MVDFLPPVGFGRDDSLYLSAGKVGADGIGVVTLVRQQGLGRAFGRVDQFGVGCAVGGLSMSQMQGEVLFRKKLSRTMFREFMAKHEPAVVVLEACGSAHYWARELHAQGHQVKLIAPQYVRPFVKRMKNDAADAEAIVVAAQRPEMRFVELKTADQQSKAVLFRARERLVHHRTEIVNALRASLYEFGHVVPQGIHQIGRIQEIIGQPSCDLPPVLIAECQDMLAQISEITARINQKTMQIKKLAIQTDQARRLQTMPGVGPLTAIAIDAFAPPMEQFRCGRDFPHGLAWYHGNTRLEEKNGSGVYRKLGRSIFDAS